MAKFTRENARDFARRANLVRWSRPRTPPPQPIPEPQSTETKSAISRQLELVREQIDLTRRILNAQDRRLGCCPTCKRPFGMEVSHRAQLLRALNDMLDRERILLGIPLPGQLKPRPAPVTQPAIDLEPEPITMLPEVTADEPAPIIHPAAG